MYGAGNFPDHVTRYGRKRESRFMCCGSYRPKRAFDWRALAYDVVMGVSLGMAALVGLYCLLG